MLAHCSLSSLISCFLPGPRAHDINVQVDIVDSFGEPQRGRREMNKQDVNPEQYVQRTYSFWSSNGNGTGLLAGWLACLLVCLQQVAFISSSLFSFSVSCVPWVDSEPVSPLRACGALLSSPQTEEFPNGKGCRLFGRAEVQKVKGNLHIAAGSNAPQVNTVRVRAYPHIFASSLIDSPSIDAPLLYLSPSRTPSPHPLCGSPSSAVPRWSPAPRTPHHPGAGGLVQRFSLHLSSVFRYHQAHHCSSSNYAPSYPSIHPPPASVHCFVPRST